jgi:nucleoside-diphosphate-sugar epimerase
MVIGNGLIARSFMDFEEVPEVLIFASGVSNSQLVDPMEYEREKDLIAKYRGSSRKFVYFSTCSIYDESLANSTYIKHKRSIEAYITKEFKNFWIIRLPNVLGNSTNPHTLGNFIYNSITRDKEITVFEKAHRYFIGIDDVRVILTKALRDNKLGSGAYNLLYPLGLNIFDLVRMFEKKLGKTASIKVNSDRGSYYDVQVSDELIPYLNFKVEADKKYLEEAIEHYYVNKNEKV